MPSEHAVARMLDCKCRMQDALDRERHKASTFRLLAQAGLATSLAEIGTVYFTGQSAGVVRGGNHCGHHGRILGERMMPDLVGAAILPGL